MGAERWLKFSSKAEANRFRSYLGDTEEIGVDGKYGWWFEWKGNRFEVGYSLGGMSSEGAALVCREIARRFNVVRIGADSVGWYSDKEIAEDTEDPVYKDYSTWAAWIKDYKIEWSHTYQVNRRMWEQYGEGLYDDSRWRGMEEFIVAEFTRLDESFQAREAASA